MTIKEWIKTHKGVVIITGALLLGLVLFLYDQDKTLKTCFEMREAGLIPSQNSAVAYEYYHGQCVQMCSKILNYGSHVSNCISRCVLQMMKCDETEARWGYA